MLRKNVYYKTIILKIMNTVFLKIFLEIYILMKGYFLHTKSRNIFTDRSFVETHYLNK